MTFVWEFGIPKKEIPVGGGATAALKQEVSHTLTSTAFASLQTKPTKQAEFFPAGTYSLSSGNQYGNLWPRIAIEAAILSVLRMKGRMQVPKMQLLLGGEHARGGISRGSSRHVGGEKHMHLSAASVDRIIAVVQNWCLSGCFLSKRRQRFWIVASTSRP